MPITKEQFNSMNIMVGTAKSLEQEMLKPDEMATFERDFQLICNDLARLADPELGADLWAEKDFYVGAAQVAKGYFDKIPFGGMKASTGQFGFRLIGPQDLKQAASATTPAYYSWQQTVQNTASKTYKTYALGYSSGQVYTCNAANSKEVLGFHRLISYKPAPDLILAEWTVNDFPYAPYGVEPFSKVGKANKLFKVIPIPGRVVIHPGGGFHLKLYFDLGTGASTPSSTQVSKDIEIGLFGLVFGEYSYLAGSTLT